jgi:nucleotide exchange factor SIL1
MIAGQSIPQGLHVRLNLETGKREAKLMDGSEHTDLTSVPGSVLVQGNNLKDLQSAVKNLPGEESTVTLEVLMK